MLNDSLKYRLTKAQRTQYLNAQNTFMELLNMDVVPLVNENDTLAVTVGRYGIAKLRLAKMAAGNQIW